VFGLAASLPVLLLIILFLRRAGGVRLAATRLLTDGLIYYFSLSMRPHGAGAWRDPLTEVAPPPEMTVRTSSRRHAVFYFFQFVMRDALIDLSHLFIMRDAIFETRPMHISILV
jgi:hypothetical protein